MNNEEKNQKTTEAQDRSLDEQIYRAMVERGWVFPQTIEEVEIAEEQMDQEAAYCRGYSQKNGIDEFPQPNTRAEATEAAATAAATSMH
jgi:hypothetical protein